MADFERIKRLGAGAFGEVWLVYDQALGVKRAVKYVRPGRIHDPTDFYREPKTLMALRHDNIVRVEDAGKTDDGLLYIAMEYLKRGSLEDRFSGRPIPLITARRLLCDICWGLEFAHQGGYVHRDIKPANVMLGANLQAKLSDFGLATRAKVGASASPYGYLTHLAPEVFRDNYTSHLSDIYALGVTAYRLVNGDAFLPEVDDLDDIADLVLEGKYPDRTHYRPFVPTTMKKVVNKAMNVDPDQRYDSASAFRLALEQISLCCEWKWRRSSDAVTYRTKIGDTAVEVTVGRDRKKKRFSIETRRGKTAHSMRRSTNDCCDDLTLAKMKQVLRSILSRYVSNGK